METKRPTLPALTGLRFFAAIGVLIFHVWPIALTWEPLQTLLKSGYIGVSLFFVLSGFILAYNYMGKGVSARSFWWARFAKVYPAYIIGALVTIPIIAKSSLGESPLPVASVSGKIANCLAYLFAVQAWHPPIAFNLDGPAWSISCEAFFYLLFPALAIVVARLNYRQALGWLVPTAAIAIAAPAWFALTHPGVGINTYDPMTIGIKVLPFLRLPEFALGMLLGRAFLVRPEAAKSTAWLFPTCIALLVILIASPLRLAWPLLFSGALALPFAGLIWTFGRGEGLASRFLALRPVVALGNWSYALYIIHQPVKRWAYYFWHQRGLVDDWRICILYTGTAIACSYALYTGVEEPARRFLRKRRGVSAKGYALPTASPEQHLAEPASGS